MPAPAALLLVLTSIFAAFLAAISVVVCYRHRSASFSMAKAAKEWVRSAESFESRLKTLEERYQSVAKREHLNARRDPVTGRSTSTKEPETKDVIRKRLGLVGAGAARAAFDIHARGGIRQ